MEQTGLVYKYLDSYLSKYNLWVSISWHFWPIIPIYWYRQTRDCYLLFGYRQYWYETKYRLSAKQICLISISLSHSLSSLPDWIVLGFWNFAWTNEDSCREETLYPQLWSFCTDTSSWICTSTLLKLGEMLRDHINWLGDKWPGWQACRHGESVPL